jgi:hypothetical protein
VRKETRFVEITALLLAIMPCPESVAATPAPRTTTAMAIFKTRCEFLRFGGAGGRQWRAPDGTALPAAAGSSSCGKGIFLKNIFCPVKTKKLILIQMRLLLPP